MQSIIVAVITFGVLVAIHEWGHFWMARRCGVKVLRFAIGFGPVLLNWRDKSGTHFSLCALPLGGYVRMLDEREGDVTPEQAAYAFNNKHPSKRIAIALAGPMANFILAIAAYWLVFVMGVTGVAPIIGDVKPATPAATAGMMVGDELLSVDGHAVDSWQTTLRQLMLRLGDTGSIALEVERDGVITPLNAPIDRWLAGSEEPDLIGGFGVKPFEPLVAPILKEVVADSAAERAGLQPGDVLTAINGESLNDWYHWVERVQASPNTALLVSYRRDDYVYTTSLVPEAVVAESGKTIGRAGVAVVPPTYPDEFVREFHYSPPQALVKALEQTYTLSKFTLESIGKLIRGLISPKNLSGPITIAKVASDSAQHGFESYLGVLALLSISLGVLNLLPIPVLDGGHVVYHAIEWLKGSPVSDSIQAITMKIGMTMVLCLMIFAIFNDISRL